MYATTYDWTTVLKGVLLETKEKKAMIPSSKMIWSPFKVVYPLCHSLDITDYIDLNGKDIKDEIFQDSSEHFAMYRKVYVEELQLELNYFYFIH